MVDNNGALHLSSKIAVKIDELNELIPELRKAHFNELSKNKALEEQVIQKNKEIEALNETATLAFDTLRDELDGIHAELLPLHSILKHLSNQRILLDNDYVKIAAASSILGKSLSHILDLYNDLQSPQDANKSTNEHKD